MAKKILIIDDDSKLCDLLEDYLAKFDYEIKSEYHPQDGIKAIKGFSPDLIILDIMLPDMDGFQVLKAIRQDYQVPVIMLTARGEVMDRVVGLELGADDYLPKPFEPRELVARMQSVLRRSSKSVSQDIIRIKNLTMDRKKHLVMLDNDILDFTTMEYNLLLYFIKNSQIVLNREQILDSMRGLEWDSDNRSVDVLVSRLRQKLGDNPKNPGFIKTIWGTGYMFIGDADE